MVWSPFDKKQADRQAAPSPIETIEAMRRRAKQRLIGTATLVLVGLVGFPLLFDTQPRPVAVDIAIEIPDKANSKPLVMPQATVAPLVVASAAAASGAAPSASSLAKPAIAVAAATAAVAAAASLSGKEEIISGKIEEKNANVTVKPSSTAIKSEVNVAEAKPAPKAEIKPEAKPETKAESKPASKPEPKVEPKPEPKPVPAPKPDDGARAKALLDGKSSDKPAEKTADAKERFIVQVGAFADASKAREVRLKVERAGLSTYTHVAQTKDGERTRVRVGPLASRVEAEKVANKIKALDLPAAILTL
jgi:DedD protein